MDQSRILPPLGIGVNSGVLSRPKGQYTERICSGCNSTVFIPPI